MFENDVLKTLLQDKTTGHSIVWATADYESYGEKYSATRPITIDLITGDHAQVLRSRVAKGKCAQMNRTKQKAEIFTPAWVCNEQNNLIDQAWFEQTYIFNIPSGREWKTIEGQIPFRENRGARWQDYIDAKRMEITCGEAPYLTSRYDMSSGTQIDVADRIGLLDRKLRVVNEHTTSPDEWEKWAVRAIESIYGYEYQGDSLLIARQNILFAYVENMIYKFGQEPNAKTLKRVANVIAWNLWQMDGLTNRVPYGLNDCKIYDWRCKKTLLYKSLAGDTNKT